MESVTRTRVPFQPINTNIYEHNEEFRKQRSLSAGSNIRNAPTYTLEQSKQLPPSVGLSPYVRAPTYTDRPPNSYHNKFPSYPQQYANTYGQYYDQPDIPQIMQPEIQDPWRSEKTIYRQQMAPQIYQDIQPMLPSASFSGSQHYSNPTHSQYMPTLVQQSYGNNPHYQSQYQHQTQMQTPMVQGQNYQTYQQPYTNYAPHTMTYSNQPQYVQNIPTAQNVNSDGFDFPTNTAYPQVMHHRLPLNHVPEQMYQYMESSQIDEDFGPSIQPPLIVHAQPGPIDLNKIPTETPKVNASIKTVDSLLHTETIPPTAKKEVSSSLFQVSASPSPNRERKPNVDDASSSHAKIIDDDKDEQESTSSSSSEEVVYDYKDKPRSATPTERRLSLGPCENLWQQAQRRQAAVKAAALEERKKAKETIARRNSIKARRNSKDLGSARRGSKS